VDREAPGRVVGYLGRADILAARARHHHEEDVRARGWTAGKRESAQPMAV
jgi:hypothetical protein